MMRSLSLGAILYALLIVAFVFCGSMSNSAIAQQGIVVGFVLGDKSLVSSPELAKQFSEHLHSQLSIPVRVRSFAAEEQLYAWLIRYQEVDMAWLSRGFLQKAPAGQLSSLARSQGPTSGLMQGEFVTRQGINTTLRQQLRDVLLAMNETGSGRELLAQIGLSRLVTPPLWQTSDWDAVPWQNAQSSASEKTQLERRTPAWQKRAEEPADILAAPVEKKDGRGTTARVDSGVVAATIDRTSTRTTTDPESVKEVEPFAVGAPDVQNEQIELVADYLAYNAIEDSYEAKGEVVLRRAGVELTSQELLWQSATQDASAIGGITLKETGTRVSGEQMQYNMATGQGQVKQGQVFVSEGNFHLAGEEIEKSGHADYFVKNGSFTTCDGEIPDWKFSAEEVDVTLGGYATAKNVFFHIKDIPVLYTPYLFFPVKTERESGLLTPWVGYSNNKGTRVSMAWYQVIDRSMDATFYLDYLSELALGKGLEYRYALASQNNGEALYYHVSGFDDTSDMYYLEWQHSGLLPGGVRLTADVEYADQQHFFDEFGEVAAEYNRDKTVSTIILQKNWQKINFVAHGRYIQDLEDEDNESVLQRLPELGLNLSRYRLADSPLYLSMESYATRFWREEGEDGERLYLKPAVAAVFKPGSWLEVVPAVALHERLYEAEAESESDFIPEFNLSLSTRLQKTFAFERWGLERLQHSIEPEISYVYIPDEEQDELPLFDELDHFEPRNEVNYELVNRLIARYTNNDGTRNYRDILHFRLAQSFDLDEARNNTSGEDQPFSDVSVELDFWPSKKISLDVESLVPVYGSTRLRTLSAGATAMDASGNAVEVDYNYKDEEFADVATDYIRFRLDTSLLKPVYLRVEERYDFRESRELERSVGLEYKARCWSLLLTYRSRYQEDGDDDHEVMINFVLAGLGQNGGFGNSFDTAGNRR